MKKVIAVFTGLVLLTASLYADVISLQDGSKVEGRIVAKTKDTLHVKTAEGMQQVPMEDVASIQEKEFTIGQPKHSQKKSREDVIADLEKRIEEAEQELEQMKATLEGIQSGELMISSSGKISNPNTQKEQRAKRKKAKKLSADIFGIKLGESMDGITRALRNAKVEMNDTVPGIGKNKHRIRLKIEQSLEKGRGKRLVDSYVVYYFDKTADATRRIFRVDVTLKDDLEAVNIATALEAELKSKYKKRGIGYEAQIDDANVRISVGIGMRHIPSISYTYTDLLEEVNEKHLAKSIGKNKGEVKSLLGR